MGKTFQSGIISRLVIGGGTYGVLHGETQIDVDNSNGLPTIIKLQPIDPSLGHTTIYINDYGNNSSVGNITIVASGGNLINGQPTLVLDTDGIGAEISVSDQKNFIASLNNDSQTGGGTITGADNGLSVLGSLIELGGSLIKNTTIDIDGFTFGIKDGANQSFLIDNSQSIWLFGSNLNIGSNTGLLVVGANVYGATASISGMIHFGGDLNLSNSIGNLQNYGSSNSYDNIYSVMNFGQTSSFSNSTTVGSFGLYNNIDSSSNVNNFGNNNNLTLLDTVVVLGSNNNISNETNRIFLGNYNQNIIIDSSIGAVVDGYGIMMKPRDANGNFLIGNIGTPTYIGSNTYIFSYLGDAGNVFDNSLIVINFGGANSFTNVVDFWNFGDYTVATDTNSSIVFGRFNHFSNVSATSVLGYSNDLNNVYSSTIIGNGNTYSGINQKFILGNNDRNLIIDGNTGGLNAKWLQVGNVGLFTGDFYVDTEANISANGDKVVGWKV